MYVIYGVHSGYRDDIDYLFYNDNFAYQWIFQVLYRNNTNPVYVWELLKNYGKWDNTKQFLYLDRNAVRTLYEDLVWIDRDNELVKNLEWRKKFVWNNDFYFYLIVEFFD